jgi:prepilin signal peptidase PulO-like enzyme (type II secretory pathway)
MQDIKDREISTLALAALVLLGFAVNITILLFPGNSFQNFISLWQSDIIFHPASNILSGAFWAAIFGLIVILTRRKGMGTADIFLAGFMGLSLGWTKSVIAFYLTIFLGLSYGLVKSIRLKKIKQVELPLVPFFSLSTAVSFIFGNDILDFIELLSRNISLF